MWTAKGDGRLFATVALLLVAVAWLALLAWGRSPYGAYLQHDQLGAFRPGIDSASLERALLFVSGWSLMTVAMMLPASLPLVLLFRTITQRRQDRGQLTLLLIGGYLGVWTMFGLFAHAGDLGLHRAVNA